MRILVANANTTEAITALCAEAARAAASPGTTIIPATPRFGPAVISTRAENIIAGHAVQTREGSGRDGNVADIRVAEALHLLPVAVLNYDGAVRQRT